MDGKTAYFKGSSSKVFDAIILCTVYNHHFTFLFDDLRLKTANRLAVAELYNGVALVHNPKLFYLGLQEQWFTFNMFDSQAWWAREEISGDGKYAIKFQDDYLQELISETNYPSFDVDGACEPFYHWKKHRSLNIMKFRDNAYKCVVTGSMALAHHTA